MESYESGEPRGARAVVGGVDYAVGGWGAYEIGRRRARWEAAGAARPPAERAGAPYAGRTFIHADDAVRSLAGARAARGAPGVLRAAALRLADTLEASEARLCDPDDVQVWAGEAGGQYLTVPAVSAADLRRFAEDPSNAAALRALSGVVASSLGVAGDAAAADVADVADVADDPVDTADDLAVLRLESAVQPRVEALEVLAAAVATQLDAAATAVVRARGGATRTSGAVRTSAAVTRGAEVDAASRVPPLALLKVGLPWRGGRAFDLHGARAEPTELSDGIYYGSAARDDPSRSTLLTPQMVTAAAFKTSGRMYAWFVLDSPEACYALRASPRGGRVVKLDPDAIVAWLQPRLAGSPPHKLGARAAADYFAHLRSLGVELRMGAPRGDGTLRFDLVAATTATERARTLATLRALTPADWAKFDWTEYDRRAAGAACRVDREVAGDVAVDLAARTVAAPKVRPGTLWGARAHYRSYVTFHTHPAARYRGGRAEPPSTTDVLITLEACALDLQAWAFVSAPEGTYVMRPSAALAAAYLRDPQAVSDSAGGLYADRVAACLSGTAGCAADAVRALGEAGFVAHLRGEPCVALLDAPDIFPAWNLRSRSESRAAYAALAAMHPMALLGVDWAPAAALGESPTVRAASWLTAGLHRGRAAPSGEGHLFESAADPESYPANVPGPLFVVYFPEEDEFPARVPAAAIAAARRSASLWAWAVFLSPRRVTVFRATVGTVEIHGPVMRTNGRPVRDRKETR